MFDFEIAKQAIDDLANDDSLTPEVRIQKLQELAADIAGNLEGLEEQALDGVLERGDL